MADRGVGDAMMVALVKGEERYLFMFYESQASLVLRQLGSLAANPELSFSWYDAAVMSRRIRGLTAKSDKPNQ